MFNCTGSLQGREIAVSTYVEFTIKSLFCFKSLPVNWSKCVEVMHHYVMNVLESIQFPEGVEVSYTAFPHPRNLTEGPDSGAAHWK